MAKESVGYQSFYHKYWVKEIKKRTGATHVGHIEGFYDTEKKVKINCVHIKSKTFELKYGGQKAFSLFTDQDYEQAISSYLKGLKYEQNAKDNS
jgi:hypothetical protein